jgi:predicted site-specific integrase-resolvase
VPEFHDVSHDINEAVYKTQAKRFRICYARGSPHLQRVDLEHQIRFLEHHDPNYLLYQNIGKELNFKRTHFVAILDTLRSGSVTEITVTDKNSLCCFGADLAQSLLGKTGSKLVVHSDAVERASENDPDDNELIVNKTDITYFTARNNRQCSTGNHKYQRKGADTKEA